MKVADEIKGRITDLIAQVPSLMRVDEHDQLVDAYAKAACIGWIGAAANVVQMACVSAPDSSYQTQVRQLQELALKMNYIVHHNVLALAELLKQLVIDIDRGLLTSLARQVSAETYDDLIDHAEAYLAEGRKEPAGVIVGVVFEDTIRRLCRANDIDDAGKTSEPLINALTSAGILTKLENKEAKAASDLRATATHALWDKFNSDQVNSVISLTRRFLREKLAR